LIKEKKYLARILQPITATWFFSLSAYARAEAVWFLARGTRSRLPIQVSPLARLAKSAIKKRYTIVSI
jgi:hypothetical protein